MLWDNPKQQFGKQDSDISLNICLEQLLHLVCHCQAPVSLLFPPASISHPTARRGTRPHQPEMMQQSPVVPAGFPNVPGVLVCSCFLIHCVALEQQDCGLSLSRDNIKRLC